MLSLKAPVTTLRMIGPAYAERLKKLGVGTIGDLLYHIPFRYEDYSIISKINFLQSGEHITVIGTITKFENIYTKYGKQIQKAKIADETGEIEVVWYNQPYLKNVLRSDQIVSLSGEVKWFGNKIVFESPEYEIVKNPPSRSPYEHLEGVTKLLLPGELIHTGRLVPIYPETEGLSSKWLRLRINTILTKFSPQIEEILPDWILKNFNLMGRSEAIFAIHFPRSSEEAQSARRRLSFDELLTIQLCAKIRKDDWQKKQVIRPFQISKFKPQINEFMDNLPFKLTGDQKKTISEIFTDLAKDRPMNRLLEGDVGSGKTVVATIAMYLAILNGLSCALMAPTEILANQHYETIGRLLNPYGIKSVLITGNSRNKKSLQKIDIYIGTHALLFEKLKLKNLGLVVIDEQQRFGVEQRATLREKGNNPHVLILTATPIPRTVALTLYSDLDLSVIDEMPKGRNKTKTWVIPQEKRAAAYVWIQKQIENSKHRGQAFIICPLIDESETLVSVRAAKVEHEKLRNEIFPQLKLGLLHGRLSTREKQKVMDEFKNLKLDILVSTPVVEVGIDVPTATIMLIEAAERFGLSQLHQLRGRVGRGELPSFCLLFTESEKEETHRRLKLLEKIFSGPRLAEMDLKIRGGGEIFGTKQHGKWGLKIAQIGDLSLIEETKHASQLLYKIDPAISQFPLLQEIVQKYTIKKVAPD